MRRAPGQVSSGQWNLQENGFTWLTVSGFVDNRANFWVMSGRSPCLAHSLTQSPSGTCIYTQDWTAEGVWKAGYSSPPWPLLSSPSYFAVAAPYSLPDLLLLEQPRQKGSAKVGGFYQQFFITTCPPPCMAQAGRDDREWQVKLSSLASHSPPAWGLF